MRGRRGIPHVLVGPLAFLCVNPVSQSAGSHIARLAARDGLFYDAVNNVVELKGANCFGFSPTDNQLGETPAVSSALTAIWGSNNSELQDFETVVFRLKLLGFNAIRLPFRFKVRMSPRLLAAC